jgi:glycosyltransferase involved in cell wall biosynthesis
MYPHPERPSYGAFIKSQIDSIEALGHEVELLFINGKTSKWNYARALWQLRRILKKTRFDVVHAHYGMSGVIALSQARIPVVISFCGDDLLGSPDGAGGQTLRSRVFVLLSKIAAHFSAGIIVKSEEMRACLLRGDRSRTKVIPNGVDFDHFRPFDSGEARRSLGLDPNRRYVLFPSTPYEKRKRIDLAEQAMEHLAAEFPEAELLVVYHQPQEVLPTYMNACNVLLMTSDWEGSSNVVKEALACNLPVVTVDAGDAWSVTCGVEQCFQVARAPEKIAQGLAAVLRSGLRSDGRSRSSSLELSTIARSVVKLYLDGQVRRPCAA